MSQYFRNVPVSSVQQRYYEKNGAKGGRQAIQALHQGGGPAAKSSPPPVRQSKLRTILAIACFEQGAGALIIQTESDARGPHFKIPLEKTKPSAKGTKEDTASCKHAESIQFQLQHPLGEG